MDQGQVVTSVTFFPFDRVVKPHLWQARLPTVQQTQRRALSNNLTVRSVDLFGTLPETVRSALAGLDLGQLDEFHDAFEM